MIEFEIRNNNISSGNDMKMTINKKDNREIIATGLGIFSGKAEKTTRLK